MAAFIALAVAFTAVGSACIVAFSGDPDSGKSTITLDARLVRGVWTVI